METIPFQAQYVVDAAGKRTHVIVPTEFFEKQLSRNLSSLMLKKPRNSSRKS